MSNPDQSQPDQSQPDQSQPDQSQPDQSQPNPVAHNADAEVLPQDGKPSQAEGEDEDEGANSSDV